MQRKIFSTYFVLILVVLLSCVFVFWAKGYQYIEEEGEKYYLTQAEILADVFKAEDRDEGGVEQFVNEYGRKYDVRITLIDQNGEVLADTDKENKEMENHAEREEVKEALKGNHVTVKRFSETMGVDYSYSAVPVEYQGEIIVLRVSLPLEQLKELDYQLVNSFVTVLIVSCIVAVVIAVCFCRIITKPIDEVTVMAEEISRGNYSAKIYTRDKDQIGRLAEAFNTMNSVLKVTMNKLVKRNAELEAMLSSMNHGVIAIDNTDSILFYNKYFTKMIGKEDDITGRSLYNVLRNASIFSTVDQVREQNGMVVNEGRFQAAEEKIIRVTGTPLKEEEGRSMGILIVIEDITKIKKLENMRQDFVSNVTHELKTPLTSIKGFADTLKNGAIHDPEVAKKFLDIIELESDRLYQLIQDILLLSEIESKRDSELEYCDIDVIIREVLEVLAPNKKDGVKLLYHMEGKVSPYRCNGDRMKQLLMNLIDNGLKNTEKGNVTVECREENKRLILKISDTGIGIGEEHLERIFERFYRVDKGRSRKMGGTGLGLSIVKHIVEMYHGSIEVESRVSEGTVFTVSLPYEDGKS